MDLDAAYRRLHVRSDQAVHLISILDETAFLLTRLPFGGAFGPSEYSIVSEAIFDVMNDLINDKTWNCEEIKSPFMDKLNPLRRHETRHAPNSTTFGEAWELAVPVPYRPGLVDGYIDDGVISAVEIGDYVERARNVGPLVVHATFRPLDENESVHRNDSIQVKKAEAEGIPSESATVLGWVISTRKFKIYLPMEKTIDWSNDIRHLLNKGIANEKELEKCIGRLNHVGHIIPNARYFLNRLRYRLKLCTKWGQQRLKEWDRDDLELWLKILDRASKNGVSINNLTHTKPTKTLFTDACEIGIGGYSTCGLEYRWKLPMDLQGVFTINLLEFIASVTLIEMIINKNRGNQRLLCFTDSSSALGWMHHSSFNPRQYPMHDRTARRLATICLENYSSLYSQHIPGKHNVVADSLSRDHHISTQKLTFVLKTIFPTQVPKHLKILEPPQEIISWIYSLKATLQAPVVSQQATHKSNLGALIDSEDSLQQLVSKMNSLRDLTKKKKSASSECLQKVYDEMNMAKQTNFNYDTAQLSPPLHTYVRCSGRSFGVTQH